MGCDDDPGLAHLRPRLTTIHGPSTEAFAALAESLHDLIEGRPVEPTIKYPPPYVVVRESA
jgi:DNA-binding LacI/PurR family transcriptional regulator